MMAEWQPLRISLESREFSGLIKEPEKRQERKLCILARVWNSFSVQEKGFRLEDDRIQLVPTRTT